MSEKEKVVSEKHLERVGEIVQFEGKPFSGTSVGRSNDSEDIPGEDPKDNRLISFKFCTYKNGLKIGEKHWIDGKDHGPQTEWYESGKKKSEVTFKDGKRHGRMSGWHENGKIEYEYLVVDGELDGPQVEWYESGEKKAEHFCKNGKGHGLCVNYYENGQKKDEGYFRENVRHGLFINWDENGRKTGEIYFEDGIERSAESNDVSEGLSFSEALLKLSLQIGKESGSSSAELPETVEQATTLVLTTLCFKVITEAGHSISPNSLDKAITQACFLSACTSSVYAQLKKTNPEITLLVLIGKTGGTLFNICGMKEETTRIITEGIQMYQGLLLNKEKHDDLKGWLRSTYDGVLLCITSGSGLLEDDKIVNDVLKPLYLKLWESKKSWV